MKSKTTPYKSHNSLSEIVKHKTTDTHELNKKILSSKKNNFFLKFHKTNKQEQKNCLGKKNHTLLVIFIVLLFVWSRISEDRGTLKDSFNSEKFKIVVH
jgi:hypothetical protein